MVVRQHVVGGYMNGESAHTYDGLTISSCPFDYTNCYCTRKHTLRYSHT